MEAERVKAAILSYLQPALLAGGHQEGSLSDETDLRAAGLVDSLGFVQLLAKLERELGAPIDLGNLEPERLTNLGALSRYIAEQQLR